MGVASLGGAAPSRPPAPAEARGRGDAVAIGWIVALPCALVATAAVVLLGPPLSELLYPAELPFTPLGNELTPTLAFTPEPLEGTRYLIALGAPALLVAAMAAVRRLRPSAPGVRALVAATQLTAAAVVAACLVAQRDLRWESVYFTGATLAAGAAIAAGLVLAIRDERVRTRAARRLRETPARRRWLTAAAAALTALWLLPGVNSERSVAWAMNYHDYAFQLDEALAVVNGLTPLHDFRAQYASLLSLALAPVLALLGETLLVFTIAVCAVGLLALMAVVGVLRRASGSAAAALALYLPFLATSLFTIFSAQGMVLRFTSGTYFPSIPFRYGGPFLLAWLTARRLAGERPRRAWPLGLAGGLVVLNNVEFGLVAFGASAIALAAAERPRRPARLAGELALGAALALAALCVLTLLRASALPDLGAAFEFSRVYGVGGFGTARLPGVIGLPLVVYLTYVAAIGAGAAQLLDGARERVLAGMLLWSGIFGLGAGSYYVARSNWVALGSAFPAWALALSLLAILTIRRLAQAPRRRPSLAAFAVLTAVGAMACSLAQLPTPWSQLARIERPPPGADVNPLGSTYAHPLADPAARRFMRTADAGGRVPLAPGAPVAVFATMGHQIADGYGLANVVPFTGPESIHTREQLAAAFAALRERGGSVAFVELTGVAKLRGPLLARGFALVTRTGPRTRWSAAEPLPRGAVVHGELTKWVRAPR